VLVALSVGYAIGGRLADRDPTISGLSRVVLAAAVLIAIVPFVSGPFLRASVSAFDNLSIGTFVGSLLGVSVLIAVPLLLLGMVSPYAVRLKVERVSDAGRVTGRLYALSTFGSLVGTFAAALLLIPFAGTRRTFLVFAVLLAITALPGLARFRVPALVVPVVVIALIALPDGTLKSGPQGDKVIWEKETEYQYARVLEDTSGRRILELNEGQAIHSVYRPGEYLTDGYWDAQLALLWAGRQQLRSVAILGNAAGTTARALGHYSPTTRIDAVEIDPQVTEVGRELFDMRAPRLHTYDADARPWLRTHPRRQDAIVIDAYRQPYIPFYLTTIEFFRMVRDRLAPGGVVVVNVGHPEGLDEAAQGPRRDDARGVRQRPGVPRRQRAHQHDAAGDNHRRRPGLVPARGRGHGAARARVHARRGRRPAAARAPRRSRVHRRPGAGRVAGGPVAGGCGDGEGSLRAWGGPDTTVPWCSAASLWLQR
jgi:predicted membrane-bound spermidine synthase